MSLPWFLLATSCVLGYFILIQMRIKNDPELAQLGEAAAVRQIPLSEHLGYLFTPVIMILTLAILLILLVVGLLLWPFIKGWLEPFPCVV